VVDVYRSWLHASESDAAELDSASAEKAVRWPRAAESATRAGLSKLGFDDAYFELGLERREPQAR
jgi:hypothetical protein